MLRFALQGNAKCKKSPCKDLLIYRLGMHWFGGLERLLIHGQDVSVKQVAEAIAGL